MAEFGQTLSWDWQLFLPCVLLRTPTPLMPSLPCQLHAGPLQVCLGTDPSPGTGVHTEGTDGHLEFPLF